MNKMIPSPQVRVWMENGIQRGDDGYLDRPPDVVTKPDSNGKYIRTPWNLCEEIVDEIARAVAKVVSRDPEDAYLYEDSLKGKTILVVDTVEFIPVLLAFGVNKCNITYVAPYSFKGKIASALGVQVVQESLLTWKTNMKFDVVVGNPPYNIGTDDTTTGTGGGTSKLFLQFSKKAVARVKQQGYLAMITPKGIRNTLINHSDFVNSSILIYSLMSDIDVWDYDTCYWVIQKTEERQNSTITIKDYAINKFYSIDQSESFNFVYVNKSDKELIRDDTFGIGNDVIRYLPGKRSSEPIMDKSNSKDIIYGPKMATTILNSNTATIVTDKPLLAGTTLSFKTNTLVDAEKIKLFFNNNKGLEFLYSKAKFKSKAKAMTYIKKFNLTQIVTGCEYPEEWDLTINEINYIEETLR